MIGSEEILLEHVSFVVCQTGLNEVNITLHKF